MSDDKPGVTQGINVKLVNVAVVLVIVCAVAFLAFWAVPKFTQKAGQAKDSAVAGVEQAATDVKRAVDLAPAKALIAQSWAAMDPNVEGWLASGVWQMDITEMTYDQMVTDPNVPAALQAWMKQAPPGTFAEALYLQDRTGSVATEPADRNTAYHVVVKDGANSSWRLITPEEILAAQ